MVPSTAEWFVIRHDLQRCDDEVTPSALKVEPRIRVSIVGYWFMLQQGLVAIAVFAEDFFPWHTASFISCAQSALCGHCFRALHRPLQTLNRIADLLRSHGPAVFGAISVG
jgi:hypothetical protein